MAVKITHQSSHPNYVIFPQWIENKLNHAQEIGDTAEYQKISAAIAAKAAANESLENDTPETAETVVENGVTTNAYIKPHSPIGVPEFDFYWDQWMSEFDVDVTVEQV